MAMPERKQLAFLESLAAERSDAHAAQLAKARQALAAAEQQLVLLQRYESGYHVQLGEKLDVAVAIETLRGHHRFMQNVAHAVRQQELEVARRRANADAIERVWQDSERRRQGFGVMVSKAADAGRKADTRRQQKHNDEFATRRHLQSNIGF